MARNSLKKWCLGIITSSLFFSFSLFSEEVAGIQVQDEAEALFLRRIVEFWEEGQYNIVKTEIEKYLIEHPKNSFADYLFAFLGDAAVKEKKYDEALLQYRKIGNNQVRLSVFLNYLQCFYELKKYQLLICECNFFLRNYSAFDAETTKQVKIYLGYSYYELAYSSTGTEALSFARLAKPYFEDLLKTSFCEEALYILSSLHQILQDYKAASDLYFSLSEKYPERKEEFLFHAASCALQFDKELALQTYATLCRVGKEKVHEAADQRMFLLYDMKKYSELVLLADSLSELCSKENQPFFHFVLGKSYFVLKDYKRATSEMKKFVNREEKSDLKTRDALTEIMSAAHQMKERDLFEESFVLFEKNFASDDEMPKALLTKALLNKAEDRLNEAEKDFEKLSAMKSAIEDEETFLFEYADLLLQLKQAEKSKAFFAILLEKTKEERLKKEGLRGFVNASVLLAFEEKEKEKALSLKKELTGHLKELLLQEELLTAAEKEEYTYLLGQCYFETKNLEEALQVLEPFIEKATNVPHKAQAHLFLAQCYDLLKNDKKSFCAHVEKALALQDPSLKEAELHLLLFNGYFYEAQENRELLSSAAEHLYLAAKDPSVEILEENRLWLSQYYYQRVDHFFKEGQWKAKAEEKEKMQKEMERAYELIEKKVHLPLSEKISVVEEEALYRLALLSEWKQQRAKTIEFLELLQGQYKTAPTESWGYSDSALLTLASLYQKQNETEKASTLLEEIIAAKRNNESVMQALLQRSLLRISLLKEEERALSSPQVTEILQTLKNIQRQRKLDSEPLHFEAALEAIDLESGLEKESTPALKKCALLEKFKEEFASQEDVLSKDYHEERKKMKDKEALLQSYLKVVDVEILLCKAQAEKDKKIAGKFCEEALQLTHSLLEEEALLTEKLYERVLQNQKILQNEIVALSSEKR